MKKNTILYTTLALTAAAAALTAYYLRKKRTGGKYHPRDRKKDKHLTPVFARAKEISSGEFTL